MEQPNEEPQVILLKNFHNPQLRCALVKGEIAVFKKRVYDEETHAPMGERLVLALDAIQDPGNLGTIIRTCDWYGIEDIYCSLHTADYYNPKVVQATMGALARVRVHYVDLPQLSI